MKTLSIARYLCAVMTIAFLMVSSITYVPAAARRGEILMWTLAFFSLFFAGVSFYLSAQTQRHPESKILRSSALHLILLIVAILATLLLVLGAAG
jgi:hypothetical protein